jgi:hypothetical protein
MDETPQAEAGDGVNLRSLAWGTALIVGGIVFAGAAAWLAYGVLRPPYGYGGPDRPAGVRVAAPRLEPAPQPNRARYEAEKARLVDGYAWVDQQAGIARIPVEQAMRMLAERAQANPGKGKP